MSISETLAGWAVAVMESLGGPGAALVVGLDNVFPPIPSELVLPLAGFTASRGTLSYVEALGWTTAGSVAGALVVYLVGAVLGRARTRRLAARLPLVATADLDRAERWFDRHGPWAVLLGRMVPLVRSVVSLPAGVERMPLPAFLALTTLGSLVWNAALVSAGYALGERWHLVERYAGVAQYGVLAALAAAVATFVASRARGRRRGAHHVRDTARCSRSGVTAPGGG